MARKMTARAGGRKPGAIPPVPTETPQPQPQEGAQVEGAATAGEGEAGEQPPAAQAEAPKRGRGRPRNPAPPSNVTDETIRQHVAKCLTAHGEMQTARDELSQKTGAYRAKLKDAKKAGVDPDTITWYIAARRREPADIDRETRDRNRMARIMGLPIGTQLGLDFTGKGEVVTVATQVDQKKLEEVAAGERQPGDAYNEGLIAGRDGKPLSSNPYPLESDAFDQFEKGWGDGTASNVLGGGAPANGAGATAHA